MKSVHCVDLLICSVLVIASFGFSKAELEEIKSRRGGGGASGLYVFPRIGRSDPSFSGDSIHNPDAIADNGLDLLYPASVEDYEEYPYPNSEVKRAGLITQPRIGRSDADVRKWTRILALQQALDKRAGPSARTGVWFGPRLGKRSVDNKQFEKSLEQKREY